MFKGIFFSIAYALARFIYIIYASIATFLDALQLIFRKLAGLDVYYIEGDDGQLTEASGDIAGSILQGIFGVGGTSYPVISTIFWSMLLFGVILLICLTCYKIIRNRVGEKATTNPMEFVYDMIKDLARMVAVPVFSILGLYVTTLSLAVVDQISTQTTSIDSVFDNAGETDEDGNITLTVFKSSTVTTSSIVSTNNQTTTYLYYDVFGYCTPTTNSSMSGMLFRMVMYNANRLRNGSFSGTKESGSSTGTTTWSSGSAKEIFSKSKTNEEIAEQLDYAFANCLQLNSNYYYNLSYNLANSNNDFAEYYWFTTSPQVTRFSKFDIEIVSYYYDLADFNFILGFVAVYFMTKPMIECTFGLATRLIKSIYYFLLYPVSIGLMPYKAEAFSGWVSKYKGNVLGVFATVFAYNMFLLVVPVFNEIKYFDISFLNSVTNLLIMISAIQLVDKIVAMVNEWVGGDDMQAEGKTAYEGTVGKLKEGVKAAASVDGAPVKGIMAVKNGAAKIGQAFGNIKDKKKENKNTKSRIASAETELGIDKDAKKKDRLEKADEIAQQEQKEVDKSDANIAELEDQKREQEKKMQEAERTGHPKAKQEAERAIKDLEDKLKAAKTQRASHVNKRDKAIQYKGDVKAYGNKFSRAKNYAALGGAAAMSVVDTVGSVANVISSISPATQEIAKNVGDVYDSAVTGFTGKNKEERKNDATKKETEAKAEKEKKEAKEKEDKERERQDKVTGQNAEMQKKMLEVMEDSRDAANAAAGNINTLNKHMNAMEKEVKGQGKAIEGIQNLLNNQNNKNGNDNS